MKYTNVMLPFFEVLTSYVDYTKFASEFYLHLTENICNMGRVSLSKNKPSLFFKYFTMRHINKS